MNLLTRSRGKFDTLKEITDADVDTDRTPVVRVSDPSADPRWLIIEATMRRFRPILITTVTTVLAMTPIALGWGEGGELQAPLARVVIGGLLSGTLITLFAIPIVQQFVTGRSRSRRGEADQPESHRLAIGRPE